MDELVLVTSLVPSHLAHVFRILNFDRLPWPLAGRLVKDTLIRISQASNDSVRVGISYT